MSTSKFINRKEAPAFACKLVLIRLGGGQVEAGWRPGVGHGEPGVPGLRRWAGGGAGWPLGACGSRLLVGASFQVATAEVVTCEECRGEGEGKEGREGAGGEGGGQRGEAEASSSPAPGQAQQQKGLAEARTTSQQLPAALWRCRVHPQLSLSRVSSKTEARPSPAHEGSGPGRQNHQGPAQEAASCPGKACLLLGSPGALMWA